MDYTNFIKTYYRLAMVKLNQFQTYCGDIVDTHEILDISKDKMHFVDSNLSIFLQLEVNINAPVSDFIKFLEFYAKKYPQLSIVLLNSESLNELYEIANNSDMLVNDERAVNFINSMLNATISTLVDCGVLR